MWADPRARPCSGSENTQRQAKTGNANKSQAQRLSARVGRPEYSSAKNNTPNAIRYGGGSCKSSQKTFALRLGAKSSATYPNDHTLWLRSTTVYARAPGAVC